MEIRNRYKCNKMIDNNTFKCNVGEHIYILDRSFAHRIGECFDERNRRRNRKFSKELYRKEAVVIREPYIEEIIWGLDGITRKTLMFDAYVPSLDIKVTLTASYKFAHAHSKKEMQDIISYQDNLDDIFYDTLDYSLFV